SGFLGMAFAAGRQTFGSDKLAINDLVIGQALVLPDDGLRAQTVLVPGPMGFGFKISSHPELNGTEKGGSWRVHASGRIFAQTANSVPPKEDLLQIREGLDELSVPASYDQLRESRGLNYGPSFRSIEQLFGRQNEAFGRLRLPDEATRSEEYLFHPVLLDGAIQVFLMAFPEDARRSPYLPIGMEECRVYQQHNVAGWGHARLRPSSEGDEEVFTGDLRLYDD